MFHMKKEQYYYYLKTQLLFIFSLLVFKLNMSNGTESIPTALYDDNFAVMECLLQCSNVPASELCQYPVQ